MSSGFLDSLLEEFENDPVGTFFDMFDSAEAMVRHRGQHAPSELEAQWAAIVRGDLVEPTVSSEHSLPPQPPAQQYSDQIDRIPVVEPSSAVASPETPSPSQPIDDQRSDQEPESRTHASPSTAYSTPAAVDLGSPDITEFLVPVSQKWKVEAVVDGETAESVSLMVQHMVPYNPLEAKVSSKDYPSKDQWLEAALEQGSWLFSQYGEAVSKGRHPDGGKKSILFTFETDPRPARHHAPADVSSARATVLNYVDGLPSIELANQWAGSTVNLLIDSGASSAQADINQRFADRFMERVNSLRSLLGVDDLSNAPEEYESQHIQDFSVELYHDATPELLADYVFKKNVLGSIEYQKLILDKESTIIRPTITILSATREQSDDYFSKYLKSVYKFSVGL